MLWNIKKVLHCHFADLPAHLSALTDPRKGESYTIEEVVMSAIVLFILGCQSRNAFNNKAREEKFHKNYRRLFGFELPHMDATNDLFESLDSNEMEEIRCRLIYKLMEKRIFKKFRFLAEYSHIGPHAKIEGKNRIDLTYGLYTITSKIMKNKTDAYYFSQKRSFIGMLD